LAHVLSNPDQEIMSYDAANVRFYNKAFSITTLNNDGSETYPDSRMQPQWYITIPFPLGSVVDSTYATRFAPPRAGIDLPLNITTRTSSRYLQAWLGSRSMAGDLANVADAGAVDPSYADAAKLNMSPGFNHFDSLERAGDFDVYSLSTATSKRVVINVKQLAG